MPQGYPHIGPPHRRDEIPSHIWLRQLDRHVHIAATRTDGLAAMRKDAAIRLCDGDMEGTVNSKAGNRPATYRYTMRTRLVMTLGDETIPVKRIRLSEMRVDRREAGRGRNQTAHAPPPNKTATTPYAAMDGCGYRSAPPPLLTCSEITSRKLSPCIMRRRAAADSAFGRRIFAALPPNLAA